MLPYKYPSLSLIAMRLLDPDRFSPATLLTWTSLFWAGNMIVGRAVAGVMPPIALGYWRWVMVILVLAPFCWREVIARRALLVRSWRMLLLLAAMSTAIYNSLTYWALHYTTATNTTLLNSTIPVWVSVASWILLRQAPTLRPLLGFLVSLSGVLCIIGQGHPSTVLALAPNPGDLIMLTALFLWGFYAVLLRYRPVELSPLAYVFVTGVIGVVIATPFFLLEHALVSAPVLTWPAFAAIGYFALFPSLAATICYNHAIDRIGPLQASLFIHLVPLFGSLLAVVFLDERPGWQHLAGMVLVFSGILLSRRAPRALPVATAVGSRRAS